MRKYMKTALLALTAFTFAPAIHADEVTEDFESVTLENTDTWGRATELSNGWIIQGGYIGTSKDSYDYGFWTTAYNGSSKSLTAQYGATNNAYVIIPQILSGDVTFYYRKTSTNSSTAGKVYAYKVTESNGTYTIGSRIFMDESATTSWQKCTSIKLADPTMIAFKMVRAAIDDVVYNTASLEPHEHSYATEWSSDENGHWHACTSTTGICDAKKTDEAAHDGLTCSVCGYKVPGIEAFPWLENFEGISSGIPTGWDNSEGTVTTASYKWNYYSSYSEGKSVRFDSYNNKSGITNVLATPFIYIPSAGVYELKFKVKNPKGGDYAVQIAEYGSAERTTLLDNLTGIAAWTEETVSLADYAGKAVKVYFCGTSNWGSGDAYLYLDDVTVKESIAHNHDYAEAWSADYTHHWHECTNTVGECNAPESEKAEHTLNADGICTVCGYDRPYYEDFENGIPASWTNNGWTIKDNPTYGNGTKMAYAGGYGASGNMLTSPLLSAKAGEVLEIEALQQYYDEALIMEYSTDMGQTWTEGINTVPAANNTLHTLQFTAPADGVYQFRFHGAYNYIDNVCGFKLAQIPVMAVTTTCGAIKEGDVFTDNFGRQTANASHTYTVSNTGAGTLVVNIASDNDDFTVSEETLEIGAGESKTFDVTFAHSDNYGIKDAIITIDPTYDGLATVTINATANCVDPEGFFADFEDGVPAGWTNKGWTIQTMNGSKMAYSYASDAYLLTTPLLKASKDDVLTFDAFQSWNDEPLKLEYSLDGGINWLTAFEEAPESDNTARGFSFSAPEDGYYMLRFSGSYNYIDNVCGFQLAPQDMLAASTMSISTSTMYATLCYPAEVALPEAVTAFIITKVNEETLHMEPLGSNVVPAYEPVVLYSETGATIQLPMAKNDRTEKIEGTDGNLLCGSTVPYLVEEGSNIYCMANTYGIGFYPVTANTSISAFHAFITIEDATEAKGFRIYTEDVETAIAGISAAGTDSNAIYNLAGQRVGKLQKGINIVGGKKILK